MLNGAVPWVKHIDPGPMCGGTDGTLLSIQQVDDDVV